MNRFKIVPHNQCKKQMNSSLKQEKWEREVELHLVVVSRAFWNEELDDDVVEIVDETHFIVEMNHGRELLFLRSLAFNYPKCSFGGDEMTMIVRIRGRKNALKKPRFTVFKTNLVVISLGEFHVRSRVYHIRLNAKVGCIRGYWINGSSGDLPLGNILLSDSALESCLAHLESDVERRNLTNTIAVIWFPPKNATHLCHPFERFVIKIKQR